MKPISRSGIDAPVGAFVSVVESIFLTLPGSVVAKVEWHLAQPRETLPSRAFLALDKPYGRNFILSVQDDFGISCALFFPGQETSFHYHQLRTEVYYVRTGILELQRSDALEQLQPGGIGHSLPGQHHRLRNSGDTILEVIEVFHPPLLDDKVRLLDRYGRHVGKVTKFE